MTAYDIATDTPRMIRLIGALHLQAEPDGGALVIDDRTLSAARVNQAAYVVLQALAQPRTGEELSAILAGAANCGAGAAAVHVAQLLRQLADMGWIELGGDTAGAAPASAH